MMLRAARRLMLFSAARAMLAIDGRKRCQQRDDAAAFDAITQRRYKSHALP